MSQWTPRGRHDPTKDGFVRIAQGAGGGVALSMRSNPITSNFKVKMDMAAKGKTRNGRIVTANNNRKKKK